VQQLNFARGKAEEMLDKQGGTRVDAPFHEEEEQYEWQQEEVVAAGRARWEEVLDEVEGCFPSEAETASSSSTPQLGGKASLSLVAPSHAIDSSMVTLNADEVGKFRKRKREKNDGGKRGWTNAEKWAKTKQEQVEQPASNLRPSLHRASHPSHAGGTSALKVSHTTPSSVQRASARGAVYNTGPAPSSKWAKTLKMDGHHSSTPNPTTTSLTGGSALSRLSSRSTLQSSMASSYAGSGPSAQVGHDFLPPAHDESIEEEVL